FDGMGYPSAPLSFPADVPTQAALIAGPIIDLNVMTRRGRITHAVERVMISTSTDIHSLADVTLILCFDGEITVAGAAPVRIGPRDTLLLGPDALKWCLEPARPATLFVIRIDRVAAND
ncbi:HutD family protein, partial [Mesorhizobium sp. M5C.F.Ca.IN.020.32.2.1]|uniref:HutD family protein n=1 Tax=Mesorhizobium sp. M5C.F.Ca.IN.020.32.2.1 TaxID=2496771 RepID=UPI000FD3D16D